jgi:hypothetical protein
VSVLHEDSRQNGIDRSVHFAANENNTRNSCVAPDCRGRTRAADRIQRGGLYRGRFEMTYAIGAGVKKEVKDGDLE